MDSLNRNQIAFLWRPYLVSTLTGGAVSMKETAATVLAQWAMPPATLDKTNYFQHGMEILGFFFNLAVAGGALTTAGIIGLFKNGTEIALASPASVTGFATWSRLTYPGATGVNGQVVNANVEDFYLTSVEIAYPVIVSGDLLECRVVTQGVDAGSQLCFPSIIARPKLFASS